MVSAEEMALAAELIRQGGLVAFPTETVYGLGANALDSNAVQRIYRAKSRPASSPLIVHVAELRMAKSLALEWPPLAELLAQAFWPGPLTIIVRKTRIVPDLVTAGLDSVALRVPAHPVAQELIARSLRPIAAPSANRFTQISPTSAAHVRAALGDRVDLILDGGSTRVGIESTVVSLLEAPAILRPGMISAEALKVATGVAWPIATGEGKNASPGLHPTHYAPRTPFHVLQFEDEPPEGRGKILQMPARAADYAQILYATLHQADAEGWDWIAVWEPPNMPEWQGIRDRLRRASARREPEFSRPGTGNDRA